MTIIHRALRCEIRYCSKIKHCGCIFCPLPMICDAGRGRMSHNERGAAPQVESARQGQAMAC